MDETLKQCCEKCVNYEPLVIGINYMQFRDFCVEHQCHVNPKSNGCKYFFSREKLKTDKATIDRLRQT